MKNWLTLAMLFGLIAFHPACTTLAAEDDDDEKETTIKFSEAPKAVQDMMTKESKGAKIETVVKEVEDGKTVYEAEVTIDGKAYEIEVAEDGTLLEKELADDEDDDKGDDDKDDDDKKETKQADSAKK